MSAAPDALADPAALRRACDAVEARGWAGVTMAELAAALGVSRMTLHRRGVRREDVLAALGRQLEEEHVRALEGASATTDGDAADRLAAALGALCRVTEGRLALMAALDSAERDAVFHEAGTGGDGGDGGDAGAADSAADAGVLTRPALTAPLRRLLREGAADGTLALEPGEDVAEAATVLFNLVGWTYRHLRVGHGWPPGRAEAAVVRRALRGVAA